MRIGPPLVVFSPKALNLRLSLKALMLRATRTTACSAQGTMFCQRSNSMPQIYAVFLELSPLPPALDFMGLTTLVAAAMLAR